VPRLRQFALARDGVPRACSTSVPHETLLRTTSAAARVGAAASDSAGLDGASDAELGVPALVDPIVLGRTDTVAVAVCDLLAYSHGVEFVLSVRRRPGATDYWEAHEFMIRRHRRRTESGEFDPHVLRFGVQFSDGRKATNLGSPFGGFAPRGRQTVRRLAASWPDGENKPTGLRLIERGRSGSAGRYDQRYWLWPHPPTGALAFVCEWPSEQIEETRVEIDSAPILEAATRSVVLWAEEPNAHTVVRCACLRVGDANPFEFLGRPGLGLHADTCGVHAAAAKKMEAIRRSRWSKGCAS
jgi:hypothetical protein